MVEITQAVRDAFEGTGGQVSVWSELDNVIEYWENDRDDTAVNARAELAHLRAVRDAAQVASDTRSAGSRKAQALAFLALQRALEATK